MIDMYRNCDFLYMLSSNRPKSKMIMISEGGGKSKLIPQNLFQPTVATTANR